MFAFIVVGVFSLVKSQEVISTSGSTFTNGKESISWTMGEVMVQTLHNNNLYLLQGYQQPWSEHVTAINPVMDCSVSVYPNPVRNYMYIHSSEYKGLNCIIYNLEGKAVWQNTLLSDLTKVNFSQLPPSLYLIKIFREGKMIRHYKIIKTL